MPGVDDPDIVIDHAKAAPRSAQNHDPLLTGRPAPTLRTLAAIGTDTLTTLLVAATCFGVFHPQQQPDPESLAVPAFCLMLSTSLCFFERGLYAPAEVNSRSANWKRIGVAWVQAVAAGVLLLSILALVAGPVGGSRMNPAALLRSPWLPAVLFGGMPAIVAARLLLGRCASARDLQDLPPLTPGHPGPDAAMS